MLADDAPDETLLLIAKVPGPSRSSTPLPEMGEKVVTGGVAVEVKAWPSVSVRSMMMVPLLVIAPRIAPSLPPVPKRAIAPAAIEAPLAVANAVLVKVQSPDRMLMRSKACKVGMVATAVPLDAALAFSVSIVPVEDGAPAIVPVTVAPVSRLTVLVPVSIDTPPFTVAPDLMFSVVPLPPLT